MVGVRKELGDVLPSGFPVVYSQIVCKNLFSCVVALFVGTLDSEGREL